MKVFGLTGGIGTGKSTVANLLRSRHNISIVDADIAAREVVAPGSEGLQAIVEAFGADVLSADGSLNRAAMRQRISTDPQAKASLEAITHPLIFANMTAKLRDLVEQGEALAGVEAALMMETGSSTQYETVVVVTCSAATQLARVMARDGSTEAQAKALIGSQWPLEKKEALADEVVHNDGTLAELEAAVDALAQRLAFDPQ